VKGSRTPASMGRHESLSSGGDTISRTSRLLAALAIIAMIALVSAGCGTGSGRNHSSAASRQEDAVSAPAGTGRGGDTSMSAHEKAVRFAECMRQNGVSQFPDPDASGTLTLDGVANGSSVDTNGPAWTQAINECKRMEPPGFTGTEATPEQMSARLEFARCIRDNGVKDFPDPTRDGPLVDTNRIPSTATDGGMSILHAAMQKCSSFASRAGVRRGQ
jgi:hypothetical protein